MRLVQWGHWNSNNVLTETTLLVNFDTHANNLKSFFLEQHVSVANFEKLFKSVFHLPNLSSLWSFNVSTLLILKFRLNGENSRWFTSFISRFSHKILMYFSFNFEKKDDALFTISTRALAQCPRQFSVFTENCLCGLGEQSGRVAKMAFISTGEISGSAGEGSIIKY